MPSSAKGRPAAAVERTASTTPAKSPSLSFPPPSNSASDAGPSSLSPPSMGVESSLDSSLSSGNIGGGFPSKPSAPGGGNGGGGGGGGSVPSYFYSSSLSEAAAAAVAGGGNDRGRGAPDAGGAPPQPPAAPLPLTPTTAASSTPLDSSYAGSSSAATAALYYGVPAVSRSMSQDSSADGDRVPLPAPLLPPEEGGGGGVNVAVAMLSATSPAAVSELGASFDDGDDGRGGPGAGADGKRATRDEDERWSRAARRKGPAAAGVNGAASADDNDHDSAVALLHSSNLQTPSSFSPRRDSDGDGTAEAKSSPDNHLHYPRHPHRHGGGGGGSRFEVSFDGSGEAFPSIVSAPSLVRGSPFSAAAAAGAKPPPRPKAEDLFLGRFAVDGGDPPRLHGDEAVLGAVDWGAEDPSSSEGGMEGGGWPRAAALKLLDDPAAARAEVAGRRGVDARYVLPILGAMMDESAPDVAPPKGEGEDGRRDGIVASSPEVPEVEKREGLADSVRLLLASRVAAARSSSSSSSSSGTAGRSSFASSTPAPLPRFRYLLVLESYSRTLEDVLSSGRVDLALARNVMRDASVGLILLHAERVVHGAMEPRSIVRCDGDGGDNGGAGWKLTDLGWSQRIGDGAESLNDPVSMVLDDEEGEKGMESGRRRRRRNWACQPPEAAAALLASYRSSASATANTNGSSADAAPPRRWQQPASSAPDPTLDLWSLGCVLHHLLRGRPLFLCDDEKGELSLDDLQTLAGWQGPAAPTLLADGGENDDSPARCAAVDLATKLLAPSPDERRSRFGLGAVDVHQHEFVAGKPLDPSAMEIHAARRDALRRAARERGGYDALTSELSLEERWGWDRMRDACLLGLFEPPRGGATKGASARGWGGGGAIPTSFVILKEKLPSGNRNGERMSQGEVHRRLEEGLRWVDRLGGLEGGVRGALGGDISSIGHFWGKISGMFEGDYMYLYFVDELTGEPIRGDATSNEGGVEDGAGAYPIEVATWSDAVPCLLPLMHLTLRAAALCHGIAGIARAFGASLPGGGGSIPEELRRGAQARIDGLKSERDDASAPFGALARDVERAEGWRGGGGGGGGRSERFAEAGDSARWRSTLELAKLLEKWDGPWRRGGESDGEAAFAGGLRRYSDERGRAVWTALRRPEDVKNAVRKRSEEFLKETIRQWVDGKEDEADALDRDLRAEKAASGRIEETLMVAKIELGESNGTVDFLQSRIDELQASLDHVRQGLAMANKEIAEKRARGVPKGRSMFRLKKGDKQKKKETQSLIHYDEVGNNEGCLSNEI